MERKFQNAQQPHSGHTQSNEKWSHGGRRRLEEAGGGRRRLEEARGGRRRLEARGGRRRLEEAGGD